MEVENIDAPRVRNNTHMRALVEDCCGWNKKTWADAVEFAISALPDDLREKKIIEIGASDKSTVAPIFATRGAHVLCSYYSKPPGFIENSQLKYVRSKYHIEEIPTIETSVTELSGRYDVIIMKSVLGGVFRNDNYKDLGTLIRRLLRDNVSVGGAILTIDNGYIAPFHKLRRHRGTGGNSWSYLAQHKLTESLADLDVTIKGFGYLNVASASLQFGRNCEFLNSLVYYLDKAMISLIGPSERAVLSTIIRARSEGLDAMRHRTEGEPVAKSAAA
jgi:hypothetical protein